MYDREHIMKFYKGLLWIFWSHCYYKSLKITFPFIFILSPHYVPTLAPLCNVSGRCALAKVSVKHPLT